MNYEEKMKALAECKPEYKDILLYKILKGEIVDITKDADLFYQINKDRVSLNEFTERDKFKAAAQQVKNLKGVMTDPVSGKSKGKKIRWLGDIPAEIFFSRPEFSPLLSKEERTANIKKWLNEYHIFRAGEKKL